MSKTIYSDIFIHIVKKNIYFKYLIFFSNKVFKTSVFSCYPLIT